MIKHDFKNIINEKQLDKVSECIKNNGVVVFPTETVYGIGANALNEAAVSKIFKAKNRPEDNPLIVHISELNMLKKVALDINSTENKIIEKFWPGPLTLILNKSKYIPYNVTCGLETVGVRMPENEIALKLISKAGVPIAAPSANTSGKPSGTDISDIYDELKDKVDYIIDGGLSKIGLESTVVKVIENKVKILRPGKITKKELEDIGLDVFYDSNIFKIVDSEESVESPGMKHRHYAPNMKIKLVYSNNFNKMSECIKKLINENKDKKIGVIGYSESKDNYKNVSFFDIGSIEDMTTISKNVFKFLRMLDTQNIEFCIFEWVKQDGLAVAIFNRILRACEGDILEV